MSLHRQGLLILGNPKYHLLSFSQLVAKDKQKEKKKSWRAIFCLGYDLLIRLFSSPKHSLCDAFLTFMTD